MKYRVLFWFQKVNLPLGKVLLSVVKQFGQFGHWVGHFPPGQFDEPSKNSICYCERRKLHMKNSIMFSRKNYHYYLCSSHPSIDRIRNVKETKMNPSVINFLHSTSVQN